MARLRVAGIACAALLGGAPPARAQSVADHPRVKEAVTAFAKWLDAERAYKRIPGVSAALVHDQTVLWSGASGVSDVARGTPALPTTLYSICSISKLFTSLALMQLRDKGLVRLDDPVTKHLPWASALRRTEPDAGEITVEGILTHASGLPREAAFPYWSPDFKFPTREEIVAALSSQETLYPPERFFQYSNLGLTLAGEIVAAASKQGYAEYVRANLLDPLGLKDTHPEMPEAERGRRLATGYGPWQREGERKILPFFTVRGIAPAAGYASTALDLARFAAWQLRLLKKGGTEVLSATTLREMQRVHFMDPGWETTWGLGYAVWRADGKTFVGHGGSCPGYQTQLLIQREDEVAAIAMANAIDVNAGALAKGGYDLVAPAIKAALGDSGRKLQALDPALERYLGTYADAWSGETEVIAWEGGLATLDLPSNNPLRSITKLRKVGEHRFKRVRQDGGLAEVWSFDVGPDGRATHLRVNYNVSPRVK